MADCRDGWPTPGLSRGERRGRGVGACTSGESRAHCRAAAKLAARAPNSIRKTKRLMRDAERLWALMQKEGEAFGSQMSSPEAMEAFMAFSQKRAPDFSKAG